MEKYRVSKQKVKANLELFKQRVDLYCMYISYKISKNQYTDCGLIPLFQSEAR